MWTKPPLSPRKVGQSLSCPRQPGSLAPPAPAFAPRRARRTARRGGQGATSVADRQQGKHPRASILGGGGRVPAGRSLSPRSVPAGPSHKPSEKPGSWSFLFSTVQRVPRGVRERGTWFSCSRSTYNRCSLLLWIEFPSEVFSWRCAQATTRKLLGVKFQRQRPFPGRFRCVDSRCGTGRPERKEPPPHWPSAWCLALLPPQRARRGRERQCPSRARCCCCLPVLLLACCGSAGGPRYERGREFGTRIK